MLQAVYPKADLLVPDGSLPGQTVSRYPVRKVTEGKLGDLIFSGKYTLTKFFNPVATQTMAIKGECTPDTGTPPIAKAPAAAAVESTKNPTPTAPNAIRVWIEGSPPRGMSPSRKL